MSYDNINFKEPNMVVNNGYFYMFDHEKDSLVQKIDDGFVVFSYPLDTILENTVVDSEYDGINFWTLENPTNSALIKRWQIENNICNLKDSFSFSPNYDSNAFTIEHYHTTIDTVVSGGQFYIQVNDYCDTVISGGTSLTLGPNVGDQYENVIVSSVSGTTITLVSGTQYSYDIDDGVNFYLNLWLFNNYDVGSLCKFDARSGILISEYIDSEYKNITACSFSKVSSAFSSTVDTLLYVKSTNIKFIDVDTLNVYGTMLIDNIRSNNITVIPIYDISVERNTIYRLQDEATYYGVNNDWGSFYNYQVSTIRPFVDSINVDAYPKIVPANGMNVTEVSAYVFDQYGNGLVYTPVYFTHDDSVGYILTNPAYTDIFFGTGKAVTVYRSGTEVRQVNIEGRAVQTD
jgi:hypothetical protein